MLEEYHIQLTIFIIGRPSPNNKYIGVPLYENMRTSNQQWKFCLFVCKDPEDYKKVWI